MARKTKGTGPTASPADDPQLLPRAARSYLPEKPRLEDHWPAEMGRIPCFPLRGHCRLMGDPHYTRYWTKRMQKAGCGDCDIYHTQMQYAAMAEKRTRREANEKRRAAWLSRMNWEEEGSERED